MVVRQGWGEGITHHKVNVLAVQAAALRQAVGSIHLDTIAGKAPSRGEGGGRRAGVQEQGLRVLDVKADVVVGRLMSECGGSCFGV